jgi:serine/threonine protein kinase
MAHPWDANWEVGERLGKGGQGLTHLTTRKDSTATTAAIKTLRNNKDAQARGRMHREVASLEVLWSAGGAVPNVLDHNTHDYQDTTKELFVVMEYVPGPTLREAITENAPFSVAKATTLIRGLCNTVNLAHTFPILHRDLKPENIIDRDGAHSDLVIVDYGLAFNTENPDVTVTNETFRNRFLDLPETNTPGGNLRDPRSDITAVCAIYYYALTGHVPGQLQSGDGLPPHMRSGYSLKESLQADAPIGQLEILFNRAFSPNVDNRFQTIVEFCDRLELVTAVTHATVPEDPIAVAERASATLRHRDRTTQIQEFRQPAQQLMQTIQTYAQKYSGQLGRFALAVTQNENKLGKAIAEGLDRVHPHQLKLQLNAAHYNHLRILVLTVASQGEQCVILRQAFAREGASNKIEPASDWSELLWYDASDQSPTLDAVHRDIQAWMNQAIQDLTDHVLTQ